MIISASVINLTTERISMDAQSHEIGVLIATCDRHEMLKERSIPSVLAQTLRPHYIVVVDDSCDEDERLKNENYIRSLQIEGVNIDYLSNCRTKGVSAVRGIQGYFTSQIIASLWNQLSWQFSMTMMNGLRSTSHGA